jgi:ferredoxin
MNNRILQKRNINDLLARAGKNREVYLPLEGMGGDVQFVRLADTGELENLNLNYDKLVIPPKNIGFPQLESLFEFKDGTVNPTVQTPSPKLLFGLRACDQKGLLFVEDFFRRNYEDIYYLSRMQERLTVVIGCTSSSPNCFCTSTGTGPFLEEGFDLQLIDLGERYLVEVGSENGEKFIGEFEDLFRTASEEALNRSKEAKAAAERSVALQLDFNQAIRRVCEDDVPREIYMEIAERCISCGGCLYVCPTCTCFNVFDDMKEGEGARFRNWDGCVFEGYTREASNYNPRRKKHLRAARRYQHKLKYDYQETGISGCVGCGRCLTSCPVDIGISSFIERLTGPDPEQ